MNFDEIQAYLTKEYPDLRLRVNHRKLGVLEATGRIQYGFFVRNNYTSEAMLDNYLVENLKKMVDFATLGLDRLKIKNGIKVNILGVKAVLVEGSEYWVSETDYAKLLNQGGEGPQSKALMEFDGKPIRYHEVLE